MNKVSIYPAIKEPRLHEEWRSYETWQKTYERFCVMQHNESVKDSLVAPHNFEIKGRVHPEIAEDTGTN